MNRIVALLAAVVVLVAVSTAFAAPTAEFWEELGGSASGDGLSAATLGVPTGNRHVSVALGPDGRPVVAYVDGDVIRVRRWTGTAWQMIGPSGASGGLPQILTDANGRMYLAWRQFVASSSTWEIFLLARDWNGTAWEALGGSGSGRGISGAEAPAGVPAFALALGPDGTPFVAYESTTFASTDFTTQTAGLHQWTNQVFVRRWAGPGQGWVFLGSGREGGGASNALSFRVEGHGTTTFVSHNAEHPALAIGADGNPVVVFIYSSWFEGGNPPEFNGENDDLYAVRWNGTAWEPLGPALPTTLDAAALGAPGGISNTPGWIREVGFSRLVRQSLMIDRDGAPILAWGETVWQESPETDGWRRISVYRWNGTRWEGLGSPTGQIDLIAYAYDTSLAQGVTGPILVWPRGGGDLSWIAALQYDASEGDWRELGQGSVSPSLSVPGDRAFNPRVATTSAGVPTVAWIDLTPSVPQVFLRTYLERTDPDLSVASVTAPASAGPGQAFTTTAVVRNGGNAPAPASVLSVYLAGGTERAAEDVLLGSRNVPDLAVGGSATLDLTVTVPAATATGSWHILAVVDETNSVVELNEVNNARASAAFPVTRPAPDLDITAFTAPATAQAGSSLTVQHTIANIGDGAAGSFTLRFFLSSDDTLDAGDTALGTRSFGGLAAGASSTLTTTLTVPATTQAPAAYRVIAMVALDAGTERDMANNGAVSDAVDVTPRDQRSLADLTVADVTVPATTPVGRPLAIRHTVKNAGTAASGTFTVRFYLSADATPGDGDVLLGSRTQTSLASGASSTVTSTFTVPAATALGPYRVLVVADALGQVEERDESNNVGASAPLGVIAFAPDLTITTLTVPAVGQAGRALTITNTVRNAGPAPAGAFAVRFYLSTDGTQDAGDVLLGMRSVGALGAGISSPAVTSLMIPGTTPVPATYQVIAVVAMLGTQAELDNSNNTAVSDSVAIGFYRPELSVTALTTPATAQTGRPLAITNTVRNAGPAPAGAFTVRFYLSTDGERDAADVLLGVRTIGALGAGLSSRAVTSLMIPAATPAGTYQVIALVDALDQQVEIEEGNNTTVSPPFSVTLYRPELSMTALALPPSGAVGRPLAIRHTIRNAGPAPAGAFTVRFYLSTDGTRDEGDVLLGTRTAAALAVGASRTETATFTIRGDTAPGTFFVIAVIDEANQQAEMDKTNNVTVSAALPVTLYQPDLTLAALTIPAKGAVGRPLAITNVVRNVGPAPAGGSTVRFYLSSDGLLDTGDVLLGARAVGPLGPGVASPAVTSLMIPRETVPGNYRIIAVTDALDQQTELDEPGNTRASETFVAITPYRPDLVVAALAVPPVGAAGYPVPITTTVRNDGPAPAGPFTVRFFLSADATLDDGDVLLGARAFGGLASGVGSLVTTFVTIPASTPAPAGYTIIAIVDALGQQTENDESNNVATTSTTIVPFQPDLTLTSVRAPATAVAGRTLAITHTTVNRGGPTRGAFTIRFYLSADTTLDATDVLLGSRTFTTVMVPDASRTDTTTVTVPAATTVRGTYHVIGVVDALDQQPELDETNNATASDPVTIT